MRALLAVVLSAMTIFAQRRMPGGYVVELASASSGKRSLDVYAEFLDALDKRSAGNFRTRQKYNSELFNGVAVQLTSPADLVEIATLPNVVAVRPLYIHPGPEPIAQRAATDDDSVLGQSVHILTGVDAVHAAGYKGRGVRIAVLDSGVDYNHPALGGGFGPGFKISGTDLVGDAYNGDNTPVPDDDPMDCLGHGTHVTGIIGANPGNKYNVIGVAPEADIIMYKIGGCKGGIGDDVIIAAMLRAAEEGADIISMSFGYYEGWTESFIAEVASRIADQGVVVTASAGNDGTLGTFLVSSPAIGENVIAVGSVENTAIIKETFTSSVAHEPFKYTNLENYGMPGQPLTGVPITPLPVLALQPFPAGTPPSQCWDLPPDVPADLSGLAIVLHGADSFECPLVELIVDRNPAIVMSYHDPYQVYGLQRLILISDEDGFWLAEQAQKGNLTVTFPGPLVGDPTANGGLMNDFSTMGPGNRLEFKPSISAPALRYL